MAAIGFQFNAQEYKTENSFTPLPDGWYTATIADAPIKTTKQGNGEFIALKLSVTGPTHQGRTVWSNINIKNASSQAELIGRQQLSMICAALKLDGLSDTDQLIGGSLQIKVTIRKDDPSQNDVKGYKAIEGGSAPTFATAQAPAQAQATAPKAKLPWE